MKLINDDNPYDVHYENIEGFYEKLKTLFNEKDDLSEDQLKEFVEANTATLYPEIEVRDFDEYENSYLVRVSKADFNELAETTQDIESNIMADDLLKSNQKQRLLSLISQYKFNRYYGTKLVSGLNINSSMKSDLNDCLGTRMGEIFASDNNYFPEAAFMIGCPFSFAWEVASCAWSVY